jgi:hypothetical protein
MPSYDELVAAEQAIRDVLARGAEAELRASPGVVHVSVGLKERAGQVTPQHAIRVYVREKRPVDQVPPSERIPPEIDGIPTDVNVVGNYGFTADNTRYRPILGGIQVSNRIIDVNDAMTGTQVHVGTLGCIATLDSDRSPVLLSNWHVLMANTAAVGDRVYQPAPTSIPSVDLADLPLRPTDDTDAVGKIATSSITAKVDGAVARIDVSSCCRCCGIDYRNEVNGLSVGGHPPSNAIVGQRPAVAGMTVHKIGMQTGRTVGHVVDPNLPSFDVTLRGHTYTFTGQIEIASDDPAARFSRHGDSGAVVIDGDGYIVGLLFGSNGEDPPDGRSVANHIADVCSELGISINFTPSSHTAGVRIPVPSGVPVAPGAGEERYRAGREWLLRDPAGARLLRLAEEHRIEILELINRRRRVTVAWHRAHGPAFLATALNTLRAGGDTLPTSVEGLPLEVALEQMGGVLAANGSAALRDAIDAHGPVLLEAVRGSTTLGEVLDKLNASPLLSVNDDPASGDTGLAYLGGGSDG